MKWLLLIGAGHAHAGVLRDLARQPLPNIRVTLLSASRAVPSSGMLPGYLDGSYSWSECCIDFDSLCRKAGATFIEDTMLSLDAENRIVQLKSGVTLGYDWVSLNLGPSMTLPTPTRMPVIPMRPLFEMDKHWSALCAQVSARPADSHFRLCMVGGGVAGVESTLSMLSGLRQLAPQIHLSAVIVSSGAELMPGVADDAAQRLLDHLARADVQVVPNFRASALEGGRIYATDGAFVSADYVIWATPAQASPELLESGLALDERGFVRVDPQLRSISHTNVFASGDCASFSPALPKAGVYAVRMGPVLARNLRALISGAALEAYRPQRNFLTLIGTGNRNAVASWGPLAWEGGWVWRWKQRIDRRFIAAHC